ncbi:MAG: DUF6988 family protein [Limisphaerales bacterium]
MNNVEQELLRNERIRDKVTSLREGLGFKTTERKIYLLTAYFDTVIEHHAAIDLLIKNNLFGSGFALLRPIAETLYRAAWVNACATPQQLEQLVTDDKFEFPKDMMEKIDTAYATGDFFKNMKKVSWKSMCSYSHSGLLQITRRHNAEDGFIGSNYSEAEMLEVLKGSTAYLIILAVLFFRSTGHQNQAEEIKQLALG